MFRKPLSFVMVMLLFFMPILVFSQQSDEMSRAIADATRDAQLVNTKIWGAAGCLLGVTGMLIAYVVTPTVPPERLLGKSPEYVAYYTSTYQRIVQSNQTRNATTGCVIGGAAVALWVILAMNSDTILR